MNLVEKEHASTDSGNTRLCFVVRGKTFESCMKKKKQDSLKLKH